jgi:two-component system, NtrC family, nitrogen regulation response regulator NtrX
MFKKILIIDDEENILRSLEMILKSEGFVVSKASNLKQGRELLKKEEFSFIILDVMLPDGDGINFIPEVRKITTSAILLMISGHANLQMAVDATRKGADDFLEKPLSKDKLLLTIKNFEKRLLIEQKFSELKKTSAEDRIIGESKEIQVIIEQIEKIAPANSKVLITGESGTGKEITTHIIHNKSERSKNPFVKVNCAAIPEELIEAELFGVQKGAFTGAVQTRDGKFMQADTGTLFLDEIGDMSLSTQTKVLRVLQDSEFQRVGGNDTLSTDVRIVAATNKDLSEMVKENTFREDLYFRLHVVPIKIPALRERNSDISLLINYFLENFCIENNKPLLRISEEVSKTLLAYNWPGNIRELKNIIERMVILSDGKIIEKNVLPAEIEQNDIEQFNIIENLSLKDFRENMEIKYIEKLMERTGNNISEVSKILDVDRTYLYKKLKKLGMRN